MRILIVKTTSMGDVVHALPAISDIALHVPEATMDWMVEGPFAAIPRLHPAIDRVLPIAWRKWRKRLWARDTWSFIGGFRGELRDRSYDLVLDLQGLIKSALWGSQARGPLVGYDRQSVREPLASFLYSRGAPVSPEIHAIERCRRLAAAHLGYAMPAGPPRFGLVPPVSSWPVPARPYAVLIPCASRPEKLWPEPDWISVGLGLRDEGMDVVVLWGSPEEKARAQRIAAALNGEVPPFLSVHDAAGVLGNAQLVIGLDTGLTHLAAAIGTATVGIFCDHEPSRAGITGDGFTCSLGGVGRVPTLGEVQAALSDALAHWGQTRIVNSPE